MVIRCPHARSRSTTADVTIWTDARRAALVARVLSGHGPGGPEPPASAARGPTRSANWASNWAAPPGMICISCHAGCRPAAFVFLATMDGVTRDDIAAAIAQEAVVLTLRARSRRARRAAAQHRSRDPCPLAWAFPRLDQLPRRAP